MADGSGLRLELFRRMPVLLQSESGECGLVCLAMVAAHYGHQPELRELRRRCPATQRGVNLERMIEIAADLQLHGRGIRIEVEDLPRLRFPCILHWGMNHFVVARGVSGSRLDIHDPAVGRRRVPLAEAGRHFTGVVLELTPTSEFQERAPAPAVRLRQLVGPVRGLLPAVGRILLLSLLLQLFVLAAPFYMQLTIDQTLVSGDHSLLAVLGVGFMVLLMFQVLVSILRSWSVAHLSSSLGVQWSSNVLVHLLRLPVDYFEKRHLGDVVSRMGSIQAVQHTLSSRFVEAIIDGMMAMAILAMMLVYSLKLALITLTAVALYLTLRLCAFRPMREATEQQIVCAARQHGHLLETIRGIQSVKLAGREPGRSASWQSLMVNTTNRELSLIRLNLGFSSANELLFGFERILVVWLAALLVLDGVLSAGMLIAYIAYKDQFALRVGGLIDKIMELRMLRMHGERLADILLTPAERPAHEGSELSASTPATLELRAVSFSYGASEPPVLDRCTLRVEKGESVAIVGPSGCGKTTLVKLALGLLRPAAGMILVGGHDLTQVSMRSFRRFAAAVMQEDQLFAGSLADNIAFSDGFQDFERIQDAARTAGIHDEIMAMPMAYRTMIGDMGTTLSGGQKQRVLLARALYRQPRILFLDEATSHLDAACERSVSEALRRQRVTKIMVAHRRETIASADRVLVMEGGRVVRETTPATLLGAK
jgi:ATP-binding cassette, subfamily B, bacterial CvaB/MchF/RaxB